MYLLWNDAYMVVLKFFFYILLRGFGLFIYLFLIISFLKRLVHNIHVLFFTLYESTWHIFDIMETDFSSYIQFKKKENKWINPEEK